jgi:hypothetical protein
MVITIMTVSLLAILVAALELPPLLRKGWWKEALTFAVMLIAGAIVSILALEKVQMPSMMVLPEFIYKPFYYWMRYILQIKEN